MANKRVSGRLRRHTHAQYVALHSNEDRLLAERFIALIFAASFMAVVWAAGNFGLEGRLSVATVGLIVTVGMWWVTFRAAQSAEDWRRLAIEEEQQIYDCDDDMELSNGPFGRKLAGNPNPDTSTLTQVLDDALSQLLYLGGALSGIRLGRTNIVSALWIPLALVGWWAFAIYYSCSQDWPVSG